MAPAFCIERYGETGIFNTDQGSQFTSNGFISVLERHSIGINMERKGRALDNVYVERFHQSLDYRTPNEMFESFVPEIRQQLIA